MKFLVWPGDGIGLEIVPVAVAALEALDARFKLDVELEEQPIGLASLEIHGNTLPDASIEAASNADGVIMGPVHSLAYPPIEEGGRSPSGVIRKELDLYANIRPARTRPGVPAAVKSMDLVIARENTEGFYADRSMFQGSGEFMITEDVATAMRKITRQACQRIGETACRLAMQRRRKVTIVTKKNVLKLSDGLFHDTVRAVAESYPEVEIDDVIIDAMTALLVRTPEAFDVVVTSNLYGDILSDLANELAGGLGLGGSVNAGDDHAIAQAVHGSAPDITGQDLANPTAIVLSLAMLLTWLGDRHGRAEYVEAAKVLEAAIDDQLADEKGRTKDLGGPLGTTAFGAELVARLAG